MDFAFDEQEQEIGALARQILEDRCTNDRLKEHEASAAPYDAELWQRLAESDLLGTAVPEEHGGIGVGYVALCLLLREVGRTVAPVPAYATLALGALPLARFGDEQLRPLLTGIVRGERIVTAALMEPGFRDPMSPATRATTSDEHALLTGTKTLVPYGVQADHLLVPAVDEAGTALVFVVERSAPGVAIEPERTPDRQPHARIALDGAPVVGLLGAAGEEPQVLPWLVERAVAARCMMQLGVVEKALAMTGAYSRERVQFDRPIGSFQAVHQRAADAYVQVEALRLTAWEAMWRLAAGKPASDEVTIAKYLAAEGGQFASYACQHLHGGLGIDVDYPLHRYFLWAVQIEHELGSARHQLERLGRAIAERTTGVPA